MYSLSTGRDWTDDGEVHELSRPKGGPRNAIRRVPVPPVLVAMLREHVQEHGTGPDGRLFQTYRGGIYLPSTLCGESCGKRGSGLSLGAGRLPAGPQAL